MPFVCVLQDSDILEAIIFNLHKSKMFSNKSQWDVVREGGGGGGGLLFFHCTNC